jgi:hypothetical protein
MTDAEAEPTHAGTQALSIHVRGVRTRHQQTSASAITACLSARTIPSRRALAGDRRALDKSRSNGHFETFTRPRHHGRVSEARHGTYGQIALGLEPDLPVALFGPAAQGE